MSLNLTAVNQYAPVNDVRDLTRVTTHLSAVLSGPSFYEKPWKILVCQNSRFLPTKSPDQFQIKEGADLDGQSH